MKMFRLLTSMVVFIAMGAAGCSARSPDFFPKLVGLTVAPSPAPSVAVGDSLQFTATGVCTTPPGTTNPDGSARDTEPCAATSVAWSVDNAAIGGISGGGLFTAGPQTGTVNVNASQDGVSARPVLVTVVPARLISVSIVDASTQGAPKTSLAPSSTTTYQVLGKYSDKPDTSRNVDDNSLIAWSSSNSAVADASPKNTQVTKITAAVVGSADITVNVTPATGTAKSAFVTVQVQNTTANRLDPAVKLNPPVIVAPGAGAPTAASQSQATAVGIYSDGSKQDLPNNGSFVGWTSNPVSIATIDATTGLATAVAKGQTTITATPKPGKFTGAQSTASAILTVTDPVCPIPFLKTNGASTSSASSSTCLSCSTINPDYAIDSDFNNHADISVQLAVMNGTQSLTITSPTLFTPVAGQRAGFVIGRPAGALVTAEVMSQIQISTQLGGQPANSSSISGTGGNPLLRLALLGTEVTGTQAGLITLPVDKPFDSITLTLNSGVATALSTLQVFSACAKALPPAP